VFSAGCWPLTNCCNAFACTLFCGRCGFLNTLHSLKRLPLPVHVHPALCNVCHTVSYRPGEVIATEASTADRLIIVGSGVVRINTQWQLASNPFAAYPHSDSDGHGGGGTAGSWFGSQLVAPPLSRTHCPVFGATVMAVTDVTCFEIRARALAVVLGEAGLLTSRGTSRRTRRHVSVRRALVA